MDSSKLKDYRQSIDNIDAALVFLLAERFRITEKVGFLKKEGHLPAADPEREKRQMERIFQLAEGSLLDEHFLKDFFKLITSSVKDRHASIQRKTDQ